MKGVFLKSVITELWRKLCLQFYLSIFVYQRKCVCNVLKPMDSFGIYGENEMKIKSLLIHYLYKTEWPTCINALLIVHSEILKFSRNNQYIKMFGVPPNTLPLLMYMVIICHWALFIALKYVMVKQLQEGLMVLSDDMLHFLKIKEKLVEFTITILWL